MFTSFIYSYRLNSALSDLGINPKIVNPTFKEGTIYFAQQEGLNPSETAIYIFYTLPPIYQTPSSKGVINTWIEKAKVREHVVNQMKDIAKSKEIGDETPLKQTHQANTYHHLIDSLLIKLPNVIDGINNLTAYSDATKVTTISKYIALEVCIIAGKDISKLTIPESYRLRLFCFIVNYYVAKLGNSDYSITGADSITTLIDSEHNQEILDQCQKIFITHQQMLKNPKDFEFLKLIATDVVKFMYTADKEPLNNLAKIYNSMHTK